MVGLSGVQADLVLARTDGTVIARISGVPVDDEHPIGAYLVAAHDGSKEWTVDRSGVIRQVAPAAARLLAPGSGSPLVLSDSTAIIGCHRDAGGACVAEAVDLVTGTVRPLLTVPNTASEMQYGISLKVMDVNADQTTVWFREVSGASVPTLAVVAVDLKTGDSSAHSLPSALLDDQDLAISRDGKWVAGQESAGVDSTNLAIRHLHIVSTDTGLDSDVQGSAVYVGGQRTPSVLFSPDSSRVAWWGGLNNGSITMRVNISPVAGTGKTIYPPEDPNNPNSVNGVYWLDSSTLVTMFGGLTAVDIETGSAVRLPGAIDYLLGVLLP